MRKLSKYQEAIGKEFANNQKLAVNAVAGSGKTTTIVDLGNSLTPTKASSALFCCFNVAIRDELVTRLPNNMDVSNFHRIGKQVLESGIKQRFYGKGVNGYKYRNILSEWLGKDRVDDCIAAVDALGLCMMTQTDPWSTDFQKLLELYDIQWFNNIEGLVSKALAVGEKQALSGNCIDFNDMVYLPIKLGLRFPKYNTVFVDECQDLNSIQREMVLQLGNNDTQYVAVGDPKQAIYGFAGADYESFQKVQAAISGKDMPLSICYRCPKSHIALAKEIVEQIEPWEEKEEGILEDISYRQLFETVQPKENDLILSRTTAPLIRTCFAMIKRKIPAKIKGRGDTMRALMTFAKSVDKKANGDWDEFHSALAEISLKETQKLMKIDATLKLATFQDKVEAVSVLKKAADEDGVDSMSRFEKWTNEYFDESIQGSVILSTVHKSKGLEADNVFILEPHKMPHPMAKTEDARIQEMNIRYVALTRAKKALYMVPKMEDED